LLLPKYDADVDVDGIYTTMIVGDDDGCDIEDNTDCYPVTNVKDTSVDGKSLIPKSSLSASTTTSNVGSQRESTSCIGIEKPKVDDDVRLKNTITTGEDNKEEQKDRNDNNVLNQPSVSTSSKSASPIATAETTAFAPLRPSLLKTTKSAPNDSSTAAVTAAAAPAVPTATIKDHDINPIKKKQKLQQQEVRDNTNINNELVDIKMTRTDKSSSSPEQTKHIPVFCWVTQGQTEHPAMIVDHMVLSLLKEDRHNLLTLPQDYKIMIKWQSKNRKEPFFVSSVRLENDGNGDIGGDNIVVVV
jgi:hypothetical protein